MFLASLEVDMAPKADVHTPTPVEPLLWRLHLVHSLLTQLRV